MNPLLPGIQKTQFTSADRRIVSRVNHHTLETCHFHISEHYIQKAFNKMKRGFVYEKDGIIIGLCIWREMTTKYEIQKTTGIKPPNEKYMDILLLCASKNDIRLGTRILEDIDIYCIDNHIHYVNLEPVDDMTMLFYEKCGYILVSADIRKKVMSKRLKPFEIHREPHGTTRRVRRHTTNLNTNTNSRVDIWNRDFYSLSPEEARRALNYNLNIPNISN